MSRLDALFAKAVDPQGRANYGALVPAELVEALAEIATAKPRAMTRDDRYAFLLNAYNVCALALAHRQVWGRRKGLTMPWAWLRFFLLSPIRVGGRAMNLVWLEFWHIKPLLRQDARGHFALVCASASCPPLRQGRYHGAALDAELEAAGRAFLRPGAGYELDRQRGVLRVTRILKWYRSDFRRIGSTRAVVARFGDADDGAWIAKHRPRVRFQRYDWRLNDNA